MIEMSAEDERDILARQRHSIIALADDAANEQRSIAPEEIYVLVIADDEKPRFRDVDVAVTAGVVQLYGDGGTLIANLPADRAEILRDMLGDSIKERARQRENAALDEWAERRAPVWAQGPQPGVPDDPEKVRARLAELEAEIHRLANSESLALVAAEAKVEACKKLFLDAAEASDGCDGWSYRGLVLLGVIEPEEQK